MIYNTSETVDKFLMRGSPEDISKAFHSITHLCDGNKTRGTDRHWTQETDGDIHGARVQPEGLSSYTKWSEMRDTLSMLVTWVDTDFRLSVLVLILVLTVWLWPSPWQQQQQEKAALNSSRNFPGGKQEERHL